MASELIEKYSNHKSTTSLMKESDQKPNLNSFELSSRQRRAERLKELTQPLNSFRRRNNVTESVMEKVSNQNPKIKETPKKTKLRGSPKHRQSTGSSGGKEIITTSAKKKSSSQSNLHGPIGSSKKKKKSKDGSGVSKQPMKVEVNLDALEHDDINSSHNAINTGRAHQRAFHDGMEFDFQDQN